MVSKEGGQSEESVVSADMVSATILISMMPT